MCAKSGKKQNNTFEKVYAAVKCIPKGYVATYGQIAAICGNPKLARVVGFALHVNPEPVIIPCHRVVNRFGALAEAFAFGGINQQKIMLEEEGVTFTPEGRVDLSKHLWIGYKNNVRSTTDTY